MSEQGMIKLEQLRFRWPSGQRDVLDIPSLSIDRGERVFIKGPSGSGKTTLLSLLGGINQATQGRIEILGQSIGGMSASQRDHYRADHIGFIFQLFNLLPYLTVLENVTLACKFSKQRTKNALRHSDSLECEAKRLLAHLELDQESIIRKPVIELSVGQQQRVAAARALIGSPELIIADEPTSALDADIRERFIHLLLQECHESEATLVFVSHDGALESFFDRSIHLSDINLASSKNNRGAL